MSTSHHFDQIDVNKDYYQALGLTHTATVDELKASYVNLAMQYHPDTSMTKPNDESLKKAHQAQFVRISEAYSVLSRPETKAFYDAGRARLLGQNFGSATVVQAHASGPQADHRIISESYNAQRVNFAKVQSRASSNWKDLQEKYKTEKWQNLPLSQRKLNRATRVHSVSGSSFVVLVPMLALAGIAYAVMN